MDLSQLRLPQPLPDVDIERLQPGAGRVLALQPKDNPFDQLDGVRVLSNDVGDTSIFLLLPGGEEDFEPGWGAIASPGQGRDVTRAAVLLGIMPDNPDYKLVSLDREAIEVFVCLT